MRQIHRPGEQPGERDELGLRNMPLLELARFAHINDQRRPRCVQLLPQIAWCQGRRAALGAYHVDRLELAGRKDAFRQILTFAEGAGLTFVDAYGWIEHLVEQIVDRGILGQKMVGAHVLVKSGRAHHLQDWLAHAYEEEIAPPIATHLHDVLKRANATDIAALDAVHAQKQVALVGIALQMSMHAFFNVVDSAEVQVAQHGNDPYLRAGWFARLVAPVAEVLIRQDSHYPRHTGTQDVSSPATSAHLPRQRTAAAATASRPA
jgi:hypothetical protein